MLRAQQSFWYEDTAGQEVFVPKDKVVVDGHPDAKGREGYFEALTAEEAPVGPKRRVRSRA